MNSRMLVLAPILGVFLLAAGCSADNPGGATRRTGDPHFDPQLSLDSNSEAGQHTVSRSSQPHLDPQMSVDSNNVGERSAGRSSQPHFDPQVSIDNFTFTPQMLTVPAGSKVTWTNHDDVPHTATSSSKPRAFDSGTLDTDQKFTYVFNQPGTYAYFCAVHPHMTGQIIVK